MAIARARSCSPATRVSGGRTDGHQDTDSRRTDGLVDMAWDPITRIVGSLGIYTKIDFNQKKVAECWSTSSIFRGYSIFMKGKDPRDAHFITSRICGICGDNHATCSCYAQNMAYGVHPPALGEQIVNLGEAAEYMFDHNIFQENLVGVDYCEKMVAETNPGVLELANRTEAPGAAAHGYKTIGDIMRALNPFSGEFYREALQVSRYTREMFCLMEGRHVHPSTLYPGGVGTDRDHPALHRLLHAPHAVRGVHEAGRAAPRRPLRLLLPGPPRLRGGRPAAGAARVLGRVPGSRRLQLRVQGHDRSGDGPWASPPASSSTASSSPTTSSRSTSASGSCSAARTTTAGKDQEMFVTRDPLGNPVDRNHPWNQHTIPQPQKRDFDGKYSWVMSPRWFDGTDHLALDTGGGPIARLWSTALSGLVDTDHLKATGESVVIHLPKTALQPEVDLRVEDPAVVERHRAQPGPHLLPGLRGRRRPRLHREGPRRRPRRQDQDVGALRGARRGHRLRLHRGRARRALAPPGDQGRQDRQLPPVPADAVERQPPRRLRHARALRGRRAQHADLRGEQRRELQGHRRHAGGAQLRSVPAVRRAHVPRQGQGPEEAALAERHRPQRPRCRAARRSSSDTTSRPPATGSSGCSTSCGSPSSRASTSTSRRSCASSPSSTAPASSASSTIVGKVDPELVADLAERRPRRQPPRSCTASTPTTWSTGSRARSSRCARSSGTTTATSSCSTSTPPAGAVHLRLLGSCDGCPSSSVTLQLAVEKAINEAAPEIVIIDVEAHDPELVPAGVARRHGHAGRPRTQARLRECPSEVVEVAVGMSEGRPTRREAAGRSPSSPASARRPAPAGRSRRRALRGLRRGDRRRTRPPRRPREPGAAVRLPRLLPPVRSRRRRRQPVPCRPGALPVLPRTSA